MIVLLFIMKKRILNIPPLIAVYLCTAGVFAAKELGYDPAKGIVFIDKGEHDSVITPLIGRKSTKNVEKEKPVTSQRAAQKKPDTDIHTGRKKDPPELYFRSGLEYFQNGDFTNALKNFMFADSVGRKPEYRLWIGKTLRNLGRPEDMIKTMTDIINKESESDVADDALLELALYYKSIDDYEKSTQLLSQLIEQYPFGLAHSTGEELREIAREQRRLMRAEMINTLAILGYQGDDLASSYRKFQIANKLPVTEAGDRLTVKAVKEQHRRYLEQQEAKNNRILRLKKYGFGLYGAAAAGVVNIILMLVLLIKIQVHMKHLNELKKIMKDLDVKKI